MHNPTNEVPESSAAYLNVEFRDKDKKLAVPTTVHYEIKDLTTNRQIRPLTLFPLPDSRITISLTPTDNALQSTANRRERRSITVIANKDTTGQLLDEFRYAVLNVRSHPV
jgi:hypothetical protein